MAGVEAMSALSKEGENKEKADRVIVDGSYGWSKGMALRRMLAAISSRYGNFQLPADATDGKDQGDENYCRNHEPFLDLIHHLSFLQEAHGMAESAKASAMPFQRLSHFAAKRFKYFPYPSFSKSSLGMNFRAAEFMQ